MMKAEKYDHLIAMINAALRNKQGQPWMYEALAEWPPEDRRNLALLFHRMVDDFLDHAERNQAFGPPDRL